MHHAKHHTRQRGLTLIELLFALAVAAILAAIATPSFTQVMQHTRLAQASNRVIAAFTLARNAAITRGVPSIFCPSSDGLHCQPGQRWDDGWLLATDRNHDQQPDGAPLRVFQGLAENVRVHTTRGRLRARFLPDGSAPGSNLSMTICLAGHPDSAIGVVLSNPGRLRRDDPDRAHAVACSAS